ncbi:hypothetical protein [uncultured Robinsoniella sp.]|uniref:hypothetical protein n=1 Tax=uncultured Robinsoniella sp. TaxID=904190 RepID=UPI00374EBF6F
MLKMNEKTYYANIALILCSRCNSEFIVSVERMEKMRISKPICPYCGEHNTSIINKTTDEDRLNYHFGGFTLCEKN